MSIVRHFLPLYVAKCEQCDWTAHRWGGANDSEEDKEEPVSKAAVAHFQEFHHHVRYTIQTSVLLIPVTIH